jgi:hypothetical protein
VNETLTLVAGILLTSVGLLALLPFALRLVRRTRLPEAPRMDEGFLPALAAAEAFLRPEAGAVRPPAPEASSSVADDAEELMAHLFSLRMTVSEITAEVQAVQDVLCGETLEAGAHPEDEAAGVEHAA